MAIRSVNPATGKILESFEELSDAELKRRISIAGEVFETYRQTSFAERAAWLRAAADILDSDVDRVAETITSEMGKTLRSARAEVTKCAAACRYYAEKAPGFLEDEVADASAVGAGQAYARYEPLGVVLAVMPWNFPLWQTMRFAAPALMAGNVGLLKHASNVPRTALYVEELFSRAGFPRGAFQTLLIGSAKVEAVLRNPVVVAATLTGSGPAGSAVASIAGQEVKKTVLELGGSDPFIVMPSADITRAVKVGVTARCQNNGQSCIAAKRFIVHADVYSQFAEAFVAQMSSLNVGDPFEETTDVGPLVSEQGRSDVEEIVEDAVAKGAKVLCGGKRLEGSGFFYPPTVLSGITPEMRAHTEEIFGPVATLYEVSDAKQALELANATDFGLGSNVWTTDPEEAQWFVEGISAGMVFINGMVTSYSQLPFGGVKTSGYGRELSAHGIREFCNLKTVWVSGLH